MKLHQKIYAVVFLALLMCFAILNAIFQFDDIKTDMEAVEKPEGISDVKQLTSDIDGVLIDNLLLGYGWNEAYAVVYNAFLKNEENGFTYVRDKDGMMYSGNFWNLPTATGKEYVNRILRLKEEVSDKDTKVVVLLYPCLYNEAWTNGYAGIPYGDYNDLGDELTAYLRYYGIDYIDYREVFIEQEKRADEIFYKTDHHWRIETAFDGFVELTEHLNEKYDENLDLYFTDKNNYEYVTYENIFIGSQGRDAGVSYVGADDFTYVLPKFDTSYHYEYKSTLEATEEKDGRMEHTLIYTNAVEIENYYDRDLYSTYLGGVMYYDNITNNLNPEGLDVLFLRDSFSSPLATFFSAYCNNIEMYWNVRNESETLENAVENGDYDYIFIGVAIDSIATDGMEFYVEEAEDE